MHKESTGEDRVAVGWQLPHGEMECPIPGSRLSPFALTPEALKQREVADAVKRFHDTLLEPTRKLQELKIKNSRKKILSDIATLAQTVVSWEQGLRESFARSAEKVVASNNPEVRSALEKFDSIPRWQRMQTILLEREKPLLKELASQHDVELVALTEDKPETLWKSRAGRKTKAGKIPASITTTPSIRFTDLSRTMKGGDESAEDGDETDATRHRMAVLLISDGRHNDGESPLELAKILGNRGVKVFTVGMGGSRLPEDLAVAEVEGPKSVFFKDRVKGKIMFKDDMPAGMPFVLKIVCNGQTLWNKDLTTQGSHLRSIEYDFPVEELVKKMHERDHKSLTRISTALNMSAEISEVEGDREPKNNKMPLRILAVIQRRKMLIVEGRPRWEWRYVRNMFERDEQWEVNSVLSDGIKLNRGDGPELFPDSRDALFAYDLIIFGELPSRMFTEKELEWLCDFVGDRAGGLIVIDGRRSKLSSYANRAIGPLFPVKWLEKGRYVNPSALRLTPQGEAVAALDLATEGKPNASVWTSLPLPHWIASVQALAGTETLAECDVGDMKAPALVLRRFGSGKVLYTSFDESWRWRYKVADKYHQRYWHQLALWMTEEPFAVRDERVSLDAGATTYSSGESAEIRVRIRDENGKPVVRAQACALLLRNGKRTATLPLVADETGGGVFRARTGDLEDGEYEVRVEVKGIPDEDIKACADFVVKARESGELTELSCNESLLRQIASNAKGLFFREENLDMIIERLKPLSHGKIVESDTMLWQSYWWFVPVVLLLALELVLRKRAGML